MALQIIGSDQPCGFDIVDTETGESVLRKLGAQRLRVVLDNSGARLEIDSHIGFDHTVPGEVRAFMGCPVTGEYREVRAVEYADGGRATYPRDFSSSDDLEQLGQALAQGASALPEKVG